MSGDDPATPRLEDTGNESVAHSTIDADHVVRVGACLDVDPVPILEAGTLPALWHWAFFLPTEPTRALGPDGHPQRRDEIAAFPRRMFGAARVRVHAPLRVGVPAVRESVIAHAARKDGSSGQFWVVSVAQRISQGGELCVEEEKDFLLRALGPTPAPGPDRDETPDAAWVESITPDPAFLFRFSAITYNAHRIHYDHAYATGVEGYPDLVVHGPLTAILLVSLAERRAGRAVRALSFRARAPLFVNRPVWLTGTPTDMGATMTALRSDHTVAVTLDAELES